MGVVKMAKTIRNNWKKSVFFCIAGGYGAKWYEKKLQDNEMMAKYCREALAFGSAPLHVNDPGYHVTVILNPLAGGNKGKKHYEQYCAPLLNLAGFKVSVIKTTAANEAKSIMEVMSNTDAVLVAGGDGSLMETVTGLMRREDAATMASVVPLGVLPLGTNNSLAKSVFPGASHDNIKLIADATMAVIRQRFKNIDIIEVENMSEEFAGKKLYGVNRIEYGAWKDANNRTSKYWYWAGLKNRMTYVFGYLTAAKHLVWECALDLKYTVAPPGEQTLNLQSQPEQKSTLWSWLSGGRRSNQKTGSVPSSKTSSVHWEERTGFKGAELLMEAADGGMLEAKLFPENVGFVEFVSQGWAWVGNDNRKRMSRCVEGWEDGRDVETIVAQAFYIDPKLPGGDEERNISLDGESIELNGPINVSLLRDKLKVFCNEEDAVAVEKEESKKQWWVAGGSLASGLVRGR